jgi:bifunctional non-homologous end joining protein LigD
VGCSSGPDAVAASPSELEALDALPAKGGEWEVDGHVVALSSLDRVYFPAGETSDGASHPDTTKRDLIRYYSSVADHMVPYLADRAINMHRFPTGIRAKGFWHKAAPPHTPEWIPQWENADADDDETRSYLVLDSTAALAFVANYGALELHPWTSPTRDSHAPTWALIDIDPGTKATFEDAVELAVLYRAALDHLDVDGMPKVTGKRGIQIWVPVADGYTFEDTRIWVEKVSRAVGAMAPEKISWEWDTSKRKGLTRLDYTQNARNKTLVAPFSARPAAGAPVSVPITWDELDDPDLRPDRWTVRTVLERLDADGDPLAPLIGVQQELPDL